MKKFIKGAFELDQNVTNLEEYEKEHKWAIDYIIGWGNKYQADVVIGLSKDNKYLLEYRIVGNTVVYCKELLSKLKSFLKDEWKKPKLLWQISGKTFY